MIRDSNYSEKRPDNPGPDTAALPLVKMRRSEQGRRYQNYRPIRQTQAEQRRNSEAAKDEFFADSGGESQGNKK